MKVLFAIDGSENSLAAVGQVGALLTANKDQLAFYCSPPSIKQTTAPEQQPVLVRAKQTLVDAVFNEGTQRLPEALRAGVKTIAGTHDARRGIIEAATEWGANLVVVGARGLGTLERLLLGSVSRAVVHSAAVPVWVARPAERPHPELNVLVACENPERGRQPAHVLQGFAWPPGSTCRSLTVVPGLLAGQVPDWIQQRKRSPEVEAMVSAWANEHAAELQAMRTQMDGFSAALPAGCKHEAPLVVEGDPAETILKTIAHEKIDLVVVGADHKNWVATTLLGSTSEAVLNHAACSVLVVPHLEVE